VQTADHVLGTHNSNAPIQRPLVIAADVRGRHPGVQQALLKAAHDSVQHIGDASSLVSNDVIRAHKPVEQHSTGDASSSNLIPDSKPRFEIRDVTRRSPRSTTAAASITSNISTSSSNGSLSDTTLKPTSKAPADASTGELSANTFLFDLIVDLTGYDPSIIDFDANLEAELGVDSIKKAQLIGEIIQWGNLDVDVSELQLSQFESLNDIANLVGDRATVTRVVGHVATTSPAATATAEPQIAVGDASQQLERLIIDLVMDQTGYDESIIDLDADLEAELGVDSIKKAQLLGELHQQYALPSIHDTTITLADFSTLRSIHGFVLGQIEPKQSDSLESNSDACEPKSHTHASIEWTESGPGEKKNGQSDFVDATAWQLDPEAPASGTHRFTLTTRALPSLPGMPEIPALIGPGLMVGCGPIADAIVQRFQATSDYPIHRFDDFADSVAKHSFSDAGVDQTLDTIWRSGVTPHLFLATTCEDEAKWLVSASRDWAGRRDRGLTMPFRVCQRWMQAIIETGDLNQSSLITLVSGGGNFGLTSTPDTLQCLSAESGGVAGLTKAMRIEAWMRGYRDATMMVIDHDPDDAPADVANGVWRAWAAPTYDEETVVGKSGESSISARYSPLAEKPPASQTGHCNTVTRGGTWIVAGGGRGITAMTAMALAERHELKLHLLGTAPQPNLDEPTRRQAALDRLSLRRNTMAAAQSAGNNPVKTWRHWEKAIEIDQTLRECEQRGIKATYHSIDVSDSVSVGKLVDQIRDNDGPIHGVIHGAGAGQDARFDRKRPDRVQKCFRAKIDGCVSLADATQADPLEWFIGFGSISGRFGANGHTDYSAANDMLAKMIGRLSVERPDTRCVTFHWHAWGDIGMATKPEAKLALDMIGMDFMPAADGLQHFLNEIEHGGTHSEVLITDRRYVRQFLPAVTIASTPEEEARKHLPLLDGVQSHEQDSAPDLDTTISRFTLHPKNDRFLTDHRVHGRPTLPFVIAIELMAEAMRAQRSGAADLIGMESVEAVRPIKCFDDDPFAIELISDGETCQLVRDLRRRDGRLVEARQSHFQCRGIWSDRHNASKPISWQETNVTQTTVPVPAEDAIVLHGDSLRCLRTIGFDDATQSADASIIAPSPSELAGEHRGLIGWSIPCAAMDAVLFAAGMLAFRVGDKASLPVSFKRIDFGRTPVPGERLKARIQLQSLQAVDGLMMSADLVGVNNERIVSLIDYRVAWIS
ncbi:MAG: SDR family NAD(P)-dependent oxidoreductase, partial [Planctomycetota bacterium]